MVSRETPLCPRCRQPLGAEHFGVLFSPVKARIVEAVCAAGENGISTADLERTIYGTTRGRRALSTHISQINDMLALAGADQRIRSSRNGYRLLRERMVAA